MPIIAQRIVVTTSPTVILTPLNGSVTGPITALVKNVGPNTVYIGGEFVTVAEGFSVGTGGVVDVELIHGDVLYGIVAPGDVSQEVQTIRLMS